MISTTMQVRLKEGKTRRTYDSAVPVLTMPRNQGFGGGQNATAAEEVKHFRLWNFVAISAVANKVSEYFPNVSVVGKQTAGEPGRQYRPKQIAHAIANYSAVLQTSMPDDIKPVADNHPLLTLFRTVNSMEWWSVFVYEMIVFKRLTGVNYIWAIPNGAGRPVELWNIPPQWVNPPDGLRDKQTGQVIGWKIVPDGDTSREIILPPNEVIPWKSTNPESKRLPLSPLRATAEWSDSQEAIEQSRVQTFKVGPFPTVLVETPDEGAENDWYLDDTFYRQAAEKFIQRYGGVGKSGTPLIAPPGYRYKPWSLAPKEMDFNESAAQVRDMILAQHGVPKTIAGITEDVNRASAFAAREVFCRETITPILQDLAGLLTELLASQFDPRLKVWFDDVVPRDDEAFREDIRLRFGTGSISPRMIAAEYGDELDPDNEALDQTYLPLSLIATGSEPTVEAPAPGAGEDDDETEDIGSEELDDALDPGDDAKDDDDGGDTGQSGSRQHAGLWLPERELWTNGHANGEAPAILTSQSVLQARRATNVAKEFHRRHAAWESRVGSEMRKFWREIADGVERRLAAQSSKEPDVDRLLPDKEFREAFNSAMEPLWAAMAADGAKLELRSIGAPASASGDGAALYAVLQAGEDELPDIFVEIDPKARKSIRAFLKDRAVGVWKRVSATAKDAMRRVIQKGVIEGDGPRDIARAIMSKLTVARQQAVRIARTEATASLNGGAQVVRESEGIKQKIWLATADNRVRDDHADADSQVRDNDDPFNIGGASMMYPGDGSLGAGAEQIVNCRCTATAHIEL